MTQITLTNREDGSTVLNDDGSIFTMDKADWDLIKGLTGAQLRALRSMPDVTDDGIRNGTGMVSRRDPKTGRFA